MDKTFVNDIEIEFDDAISLTVILPFLEDKVTHSLTFKIKKSIVNDKVFGYLQHEEIDTNDLPEFRFRIESDDFPLNGTITVTAVTESGYECNYTETTQRFSKTKKITDLQYSYTLAEDANDMDAINAEIDAINDTDIAQKAPFCFPKIKNNKIFENFLINKPSLYNTSINQNFTESNVVSLVGENWQYGVLSVAVPCFYLHFILEQIITDSGYQFDNVFKNHPDLKNMTLLNPNCINKYELEEVNVPCGFYIIAITADSSCTIITLQPHGLTTGSYIAIYGNEAAGMTQLLNKTFRITVSDEYNFSLDDVDSSDYSAYTPGTYHHYIYRFNQWNYYDNVVYLRNHLPNLTYAEFIKGFEDFIGCRFDIKNDIVTVRYLNDAITQQHKHDISECFISKKEMSFNRPKGYTFSYKIDSNDDTLSNVEQIKEDYNIKSSVQINTLLPETGNKNNDVRLCVLNNRYYLYNEYSFLKRSDAQIGKWDPYTLNLFPFTVGEKDKSIDFIFSPFEYGEWLGVITANVPISCSQFGGFNREFIPRLFYYRGKTGFTNAGVSYVYGKLPDTLYSLVIKGDASVFGQDCGIYEYNYSKYCYWNMHLRKDYKMQINWPSKYIINAGSMDKFRINGNNYFVKKINLVKYPDKVVYKDTEVALAP